jgi:nitroimidazol reductase NimA-like FMN-containing flavoprotein (pyridoxamine 5'-phosphate oxidase superfamily)
MSTNADQIKILDESECWLILRTSQLGRLAVSTPPGVDIFPVNFVVDHGGVVFRTAAGTKLDSTLTGARIAFEADGQDAATHELWSVVMHGTATEIREMDEVLDALRLPLTPAQGNNKPRFLRISADSITGRRFVASDPERWMTPVTHATRAPRE